MLDCGAVAGAGQCWTALQVCRCLIMMLTESEEWSDDRAAEHAEAPTLADGQCPRRGRRKEHDQSVFMQRRGRMDGNRGERWAASTYCASGWRVAANMGSIQLALSQRLVKLQMRAVANAASTRPLASAVRSMRRQRLCLSGPMARLVTACCMQPRS